MEEAGFEWIKNSRKKL